MNDFWQHWGLQSPEVVVLVRVQFKVDGTQHEQDNLLRRFRQIAAAHHVECFGAADTE
jgi:autonomous glycyl radical cofactor GrcA